MNFLNLIESFGIKLHVSDPTQRTGHTIDIVRTRDRDPLAPTVSSQDHCFPDHFPVFCDLSLTTEYSRLQEVTYRKIKAKHVDGFIRDVSASALCITSATIDLDADVAQYSTTLSTMHAPEKTRRIPARPQPDGTTMTSEWRSSHADRQRDCGGIRASQYTTTCPKRDAGCLALRSMVPRNTVALYSTTLSTIVNMHDVALYSTTLSTIVNMHDVALYNTTLSTIVNMLLMWPYTTLLCQPLSTCMMWPYTTLPCQP